MENTSSNKYLPIIVFFGIIVLISSFLFGWLFSGFTKPLDSSGTQINVPIAFSSDIVKKVAILYSLYGRVDSIQPATILGHEGYIFRMISVRGEALPIDLQAIKGATRVSAIQNGHQVTADISELEKNSVIRVDYNVDPKDKYKGQVVQIIIEK